MVKMVKGNRFLRLSCGKAGVSRNGKDGSLVRRRIFHARPDPVRLPTFTLAEREQVPKWLGP